MSHQPSTGPAPEVRESELFILELDERQEFEALPLMLAAGINFGCNGGICEQTICPIPPA